ncbi:MAG: hypothetical protein GVY02_08345 [Bacteroidetes bacterium]|nr:hypothetical protein [Bacteroidota bacterium]
MKRSMSNNFQFQRTQLLIKRYFALNRKQWGVGFLSIGGFLIAISVPQYISDFFNLTGGGFGSLRDTAIFFYVFGGLILSSSVFSEIHKPTTSFQYFTLPATTGEKLAAAWLSLTLIYTVIASTGILILSIILELLQSIDSGVWANFEIFNPLNADFLNTAVSYIYYQSFFLLGAVYFKNNHFLKTFLAIVAFFIIATTIVSAFLLITGIQEFTFSISPPESQEMMRLIEHGIGITIMIVFLFFSFLQLKNKQIA